MKFLDDRRSEIADNLYGYFSDRLDGNPQALLEQVDQELKSLYVSYGNDWSGRGIVGDTALEAMIAGLEAVRAECLERLGQPSR